MSVGVTIKCEFDCEINVLKRALANLYGTWLKNVYNVKVSQEDLQEGQREQDIIWNKCVQRGVIKENATCDMWDTSVKDCDLVFKMKGVRQGIYADVGFKHVGNKWEVKVDTHALQNAGLEPHLTTERGISDILTQHVTLIQHLDEAVTSGTQIEQDVNLMNADPNQTQVISVLIPYEELPDNPLEL